MKKKLLIVNKAQFGYHIDTYKYCVYLKDDFEITYLGFDFGLSQQDLDGVNVKYISREGNKIKRYFNFLKTVNQEIKNGNYDLTFLVYFHLAAIIKWLNPHQVFNIDIRTGADTRNALKNFYKDMILKIDCAFFKHVSILDHALAESLSLQQYHFLPLGGECFSETDKSFTHLHLLYVGTLENRNLIECVKGFHLFLKEFKEMHSPEVIFTIIGDSPGNELQEIRAYLKENNLTAHIKTLGYIPNSQLSPYFEKANIGISFIPMTQYYENQPPTKTFEYLLSGLPVIATRTNANVEILNDNCGVLIEDNARAFAKGLKELIGKRHFFDTQKIKELYQDNLWGNIVQNNLKPYVYQLITGKNKSLHSVSESV